MATTANMRSSQHKRQLQVDQLEINSKKSSMEIMSVSSSKELVLSHIDSIDDQDVVVSGCSTPKGERYKIPELLSCPPPPKKRKVAPSCSSNRSRPIAFYAPPDLELFFLFAFRNTNSSC